MATDDELAKAMARVIELAEARGPSRPLSQEDLKAEFGALEVVHQALNKLTNSRRLEMVTGTNGEIMWAVNSQEQAAKFRGLSQDHMIVLQEIRTRGGKGIFKKELKKLTGLPQAQLSRILKLLETRRLVKTVKTVTSKNMNLYMLIDVEPLREHTGGPWYTEQEFDVEFVERISKWMYSQVERFQLASPEKTTLAAMTEALQNAKVLNVELTTEDLRCVLNKLVYENKIEPQGGQDGQDAETFARWTWKTTPVVRTHNFLDQVPCGVCPVRKDCTPGGVISPSTCVYIDPWLSSKRGGEDLF